MKLCGAYGRCGMPLLGSFHIGSELQNRIGIDSNSSSRITSFRKSVNKPGTEAGRYTPGAVLRGKWSRGVLVFIHRPIRSAAFRATDLQLSSEEIKDYLSHLLYLRFSIDELKGMNESSHQKQPDSARTARLDAHLHTNHTALPQLPHRTCNSPMENRYGFISAIVNIASLRSVGTA